MTNADLNVVWASQAGQHTAVVRNIHEMLARLSRSLSDSQRKTLLDQFKLSWTTTSDIKAQSELLSFIKRLAKDDPEGIMAQEVLSLLWNFAHNPSASGEMCRHVLEAHADILTQLGADDPLCS